MPGQVTESSNVVPGHRVPRALIEQVLAGPVDSSTMTVLLDGQYSRRLLLLKALRESVASTGSHEELRAIEDSWSILVAAEKRMPATVREILLYPSVGTWLVRIIRKIRGIIEDDVPIWVDMGYLGSIAAAVAARPGRSAVRIPKPKCASHSRTRFVAPPFHCNSASEPAVRRAMAPARSPGPVPTNARSVTARDW
jgi:hypothetical protein